MPSVEAAIGAPNASAMARTDAARGSAVGHGTIVMTPAQSGGVRDYGALIAARIGAAHVTCADDDPATLASATADARIVYLQFSGYGFQPRGIPLGLVRWSRDANRRGQRVGVFFHELFAFGPPWTSSFWLNPAQKFIAIELTRGAAFWIANRQASAAWLSRWAPARPHDVLATMSNVGELAREDAPRARHLIVFGTAGLRETTYRDGRANFLPWARREGFEVHDIGPPLHNVELTRELQQFGVHFHGRLEPSEIGPLMTGAMAGAIAYPLAYASKSGVLAAYCAYGLCPVLYSTHHAPSDGLARDINYVGRLSSVDGPSQLATVGRAARAWYRRHSERHHVEVTARMIEGVAA